MKEQIEQPTAEEIERAKVCPIIRQALAYGALGDVDLREVVRSVKLPEAVLSMASKQFGFVKNPGFYEITL